MATIPQPIVSIGIIFRNEIRCLERCLKSLEPLRAAIPCELIMADTGSCDGSREIAIRYADILFDFPWINDFSAARNAVIEKASGKWYLSIDADEYLDTDIIELIEFFKSVSCNRTNICSLVIRNYKSVEDFSQYSDFLAMRIMRLATGLRYVGAIHEAWPFEDTNEPALHRLSHTLLHHDGYIEMHGKKGATKRNRNLALLNQKLSRTPNNLLTLLQYIESGKTESDLLEKLHLAVLLVEKKQKNWNELGPSIFRHAVCIAHEKALPELEEWIERSQNLFPSSYFTRIDVEYVVFTRNWDNKDYASCISGGERFLQAIQDLKDGKGDQEGLHYGCVNCSSAHYVQTLTLLLAAAYAIENRYKQAIRLLNGLDYALLNDEQVRNCLYILRNIHAQSNEDTAPVLLSIFTDIEKSATESERTQKRKEMFYRVALQIFSSCNIENESSSEDFCRSPYSLFTPLGARSELGLGALIMQTNDISDIHRLLSEVSDWGKFPADALFHALESGVRFPLPECPLTAEEIDGLALKLASTPERLHMLIKSVKNETPTVSWQELSWKRAILLAAVRTFCWKGTSESDDSSQVPKKNTDNAASDMAIDGMELMHVFAKIEDKFLSRYYSPELLCEENLLLLPALHRFGWYCVKAFKALDADDLSGYIHELKKGLNVCQEATSIVEYLTENTPQLKPRHQKVPEELRVLSEQVKQMLSAYPADHPAVIEIKKNPVYQKVAWLIENEK